MNQIKRIANFFQSDKGNAFALVGIGILLAGGSFLLGRLSLAGDIHQNIAIQSPNPNKEEEYSQDIQNVALAAVSKQEHTLEQKQVATGGKYVASKSGSAYHFPWCSGAKRIKEENKVYFNSKEEAEKAGYHPAGNCKGL